MKLIAPAILCSIMAFGLLAGCKKDSSGVSLQQKITGKWSMKTAIGSYTTQGSKRSDTTRFTSADYLELKADGRVSISESNIIYTGMWNIIDGKLHISKTGYMDYANGFELPIVETNRLQLYYTEASAISLLEQKLNLSK
jgi:hypothetical protein